MHKISKDKAQMLTDTVQSSGGLVLSIVPREEPLLMLWVCVVPLKRLAAKQTLNIIFAFPLFFV